MTSADGDHRSDPSKMSRHRWKRVQDAYRSGELDKRHLYSQPEQKRTRRNALADVVNPSNQKPQVHQLIERIRELQNEIVPDVFFYPMAPTYTPFSPVPSSSGTRRGSISLYPNRQSLSISSGSLNSMLSNQRFALSPKMIERAHQIPERFWLDWQEKQMQDQIEELEYIKNNIIDSSNSSLPSLENDENEIDFINIDRRRSLKFLHEAQRLANERRASLARATTTDESSSKENQPSTTNLIRAATIDQSTPTPRKNRSNSHEFRAFNFDQRSITTSDQANIDDLKESPLNELATPRSPVLHSRSTMTLPFTYLHIREPIRFPNDTHPISTEVLAKKVIETNDVTTQTNSPTDQIDLRTQINLQREVYPRPLRPLLYSNGILNRKIEFLKFQPLSTLSTTMTSIGDTPIQITVCKRKEIDDSQLSSPTLSFKSVRSSFSPMNISEELDDDKIRITSSVIPPSSSSSFFSHSRSLSILSTSTSNTCGVHQRNSFLLKEKSLSKCTCTFDDQSMINVYELQRKNNTSSSSSSLIAPSSENDEERKDNLSFSHTFFTYRKQQQQRRRRTRKRKKKGKPLNLSSVSTFSSLNTRTSRGDLLGQRTKYLNYHQNNVQKQLVNTSIISTDKLRLWKQNDGGFQRDVLTNDNTDGDDERVTCSSSSSSSSSLLPVAATVDRLIHRQRRKQTRLKRKSGSEKKEKQKKKKKKKKTTKKEKERNKKSLSSSIEAEATEASLFQFVPLNTPTIDTSVSFYPYEQQSKCAEKNTRRKKENCFSIQTSGEHQQQHHKQQQKQEFESDLITMADGHGNRKKKDNIRVFVHRHRRGTSKRTFRHSSSSAHSHETISSTASSSATNMRDFLSLIQQQVNSQEKKSRKNRNIIVVNYKPVFLNSPRTKPSPPVKNPPVLVSKPKIFPTDDEFSSATHYSRRRSLTTTSSDGSPRRSPANRMRQEQSLSLDVPDVEDPLMFIEMMYQQLFTEDGQLRSGTEPTILANCVKQIVTNSRRNSISSSVANGSPSPHLKQKNLNVPQQQQQQQQRTLSASSYRAVTPSKPISISSSPRLMPAERYDTFSEEEENEDDEEPNTIVQVTKTNVERTPPRSNLENHSQIQAFLNSYPTKRSSTRKTTNDTFQLSVDDTDNEDLDTFSDFNSTRFITKPIQTSPSVEDDFTHTDSRLLSSSGYHSFVGSQKSSSPSPPKRLRSKSHSETDLSHLSLKHDIQTSQCFHHCPNCIRPLNITVIPPMISSSNFLQRIQQPIGVMLLKYLNFLLLSKNVLLLPLFIFLLRQRSIHLGN